MTWDTRREIGRDELAKRVGQPLGTSEWMTIDHQRVDRFADVTDDHQFVHVDASAVLTEAAERKPGQVLMKLDVTIAIEGETKPAVTAEWLSLHVVA